MSIPRVKDIYCDSHIPLEFHSKDKSYRMIIDPIEEDAPHYVVTISSWEGHPEECVSTKDKKLFDSEVDRLCSFYNFNVIGRELTPEEEIATLISEQEKELLSRKWITHVEQINRDIQKLSMEERMDISDERFTFRELYTLLGIGRRV